MTHPAGGRGGSGISGAETFESLRPLLFSIAYRMLSSVTDAEDVVQEAFVRFQQAQADGVTIASPKGYLSSVVTRLSIDQLRSARHRREAYVGQWLPAPLLTDEAHDPADLVEQVDTLSMAFLLVLERLNPVERAVFLLHDAFACPYDEISEIVGKTEANSRQLAARARQHVRAEKPRFEASAEQRDALASQFFDALRDGDVDGLVSMLAANVVTYGDGGGKAPQWARPVAGAGRVGRLFAALSDEIRRHRIRIEPHAVNGQPGAIMRTPAGEIVNVFVLDITDGKVQTIRSVINPDKLGHLGPVADVRALRAQDRQHADTTEDRKEQA